MTHLDQMIRTRQSEYPKDFNEKEVTLSEIEQILSVSAYAPSHKKTMPWRFVVFRGASKNQLGAELARLYQEIVPAEKFLEKKYKSIPEKAKKSSAVLAIIVELSGKVPAWEEEASVAMAVQNIWLKANEIGVAGYWSSPKLIEYLNDFLNLKDNQKCLGLFYLGKTDQETTVRSFDWKKFVNFRD